MSRTAEDWGRLAVSLPGWRWMPGMFVPQPGHGRLDDENVSDHPLYRLPLRHADECWPDPDDPATEGCMIRLLGHGIYAIRLAGLEPDGTALLQWHDPTPDEAGEQWSAERLPLGRAAIAAAEALGRWPNGGRMVAE